jgi:hypothetical protein
MGFKAAPQQKSQFLSERQNFCGQLQKQSFATEFPQEQTFSASVPDGCFVPTTVICSTAHWDIAMPVEEPSTASKADIVHLCIVLGNPNYSLDGERVSKSKPYGQQSILTCPDPPQSANISAT